MNGQPAAARTALVLGMGHSGEAAARHLAARGWALRLADTRAAPPMLEALRARFGAEACHCGAFTPALLDGVERLVLSPGLPGDLPIVRAARARGVEVVGEVELFAREANAPVVAITGSNGKSTVTRLVEHLLRAAGRIAPAGGNLGTPAVDLLRDPPPDVYVLELSSFQLETLESLQRGGGHGAQSESPTTWTATRTWPPTPRPRRASTRARGAVRVQRRRPGGPRPPPGAGRAQLRRGRGRGLPPRAAAAARNGCTRVTRPLAPRAALPLAGRHNALNVLAAVALGRGAGRGPAAARRGLRRVHTLAASGGAGGRDATGCAGWTTPRRTNVGAALAAIQGCDGPVVLIAGGDGKGQDFAPLAAGVAGRLRAAVLIGRDAPRLEAALAPVAHCERAADLDEAVARAAALARPGDTVLLAPACASWDMFRDYHERGERFVAAVVRLRGREGAA
ncbi:MAG: hypothetical protein KatS3mg121_0478 [Gammaproteobacteria bacterium]|nr:MAG: hypothetical protein KatS3mg121_0478 [Gammaproteobacteria bacterium]